VLCISVLTGVERLSESESV